MTLDFFSGSGSFAQATLEQSVKDGVLRQYIVCQLPQELDENSKSNTVKSAFKFLRTNNLPTTLDYIGIERIKRAAAKIKQEHPGKELDLGFKHFVLAEPSDKTLDKLYSFDPTAIFTDNSLLDEFGKPAVLATWLCADGYGLTATAQAINLAGYTAYHCDKHLYLMDSGFSLEAMKALLARYDADGRFSPEDIVLFGYSFTEWSINEMIEKNLRILNDGEKNLKVNFSVRY